MKRILALLLLLPATALGQSLPAKYVVALSETGSGLSRGLVFHAPFTDPANPLTIYKGTGALTFTRAHDATHTATFTHPTTGLVTVASADQLRVEARGALVEEARTNILPRSQQFDNTDAWSFWGAASVTAGFTSPAGDNTAFRLSMPAANSGIHATVSTTATTYAASIWIRADSTGAIRFFNGAGGGFDNTINVTTSWQRYETVAAEDGASGQFGLYRNNAGQLDNVYIWGPQWEVGASATSYIPTVTGVMSRSADTLGFPTIGSPGTSIASVDGVKSEVTYVEYNPVGHHTGGMMVWGRVLSGEEKLAITGH